MKNKNTVTGLIVKYFDNILTVLFGACFLSIILGIPACLWIWVAEGTCYGGTCISEFEGEIRTIDLFASGVGTFCGVITLVSMFLVMVVGMIADFFDKTSEDDSANVCSDEDKYRLLLDNVSNKEKKRDLALEEKYLEEGQHTAPSDCAAPCSKEDEENTYITLSVTVKRAGQESQKPVNVS